MFSPRLERQLARYSPEQRDYISESVHFAIKRRGYAAAAMFDRDARDLRETATGQHDLEDAHIHTLMARMVREFYKDK